MVEEFEAVRRKFVTAKKKFNKELGSLLGQIEGDMRQAGSNTNDSGGEVAEESSDEEKPPHLNEDKSPHS